jgi:predicted site-specific integrase-resolvase
MARPRGGAREVTRAEEEVTRAEELAQRLGPRSERSPVLPKRVVLYARVSTDNQTVENQLRELQAAAIRLDCSIVGIFTDEGITEG